MGVCLCVYPVHQVQAFTWRIDYLSLFPGKWISDYLGKRMNEYLQDLSERATGEYQGSIVEMLHVHQHRGEATRLATLTHNGLTTVTERLIYHEAIVRVPVEGKYETVFFRYFTDGGPSMPVIFESPFNPTHRGKYRTSCTETYNSPLYNGGSTWSQVVRSGLTEWRLNLQADNLSRGLKEYAGLEFVLEMAVRPLDAYCHVTTHPSRKVNIVCPVRWNGEAIIRVPENQVFVLSLTNLGGTLWKP